jgi:thiosulfate/3-mercaptopyruvate sulfurtransferase
LARLYDADVLDEEAVLAWFDAATDGGSSARERAAALGFLVDVRSPGEFSGELLHMPDYPQEGVQRGGHVPTAQNVPWKRAANDDGSFKSVDDLRGIYEGELGMKAGDDVITYCRIGERSSHTWFVLTHLLGFEHVRNYDGSWVEWGNAVRVPIEKPA